LTTSIINAYNQRVLGVYDIPGAFLHAEQTDLTHIKMAGEAADFLFGFSPETYRNRSDRKSMEHIIACLKEGTIWLH
jgi:hypothetical protein